MTTSQAHAPREYVAIYRRGKWIPVDQEGEGRKDSRQVNGTRVHDPSRCLLCQLEAVKNGEAEE